MCLNIQEAVSCFNNEMEIYGMEVCLYVKGEMYFSLFYHRTMYFTAGGSVLTLYRICLLSAHDIHHDIHYLEQRAPLLC